MRHVTGTMMMVASFLLAIASCDGGGDSGDSPADPTCSPGEACSCQGGAVGTAICHDDGSLAACVCGPADGAECATRSDEHCDGIDNDCNGAVDDGGVCPDRSIKNASPFTEAVYLHAGPGGACGSFLQRIWPTPSTIQRGGFECFASSHRFRRSDGALHYWTSFTGIHRDTEDAQDPLVPSPPCTGFDLGDSFDFDAAGTLYYRCASAVRKGAGEVVTGPARSVAVLDDGRLLITRFGEPDTIILDGAGQELSRLDPRAELAGTLSPFPDATYVQGNRAYVLYRRSFPSRQKELVVYRVDESSRWALVRRVPTEGVDYDAQVLSDGTVLVFQQDPAPPGASRVVAYPPDGPAQVLFRERHEQGSIRVEIPDAFVVGPL